MERMDPLEGSYSRDPLEGSMESMDPLEGSWIGSLKGSWISTRILDRILDIHWELGSSLEA